MNIIELEELLRKRNIQPSNRLISSIWGMDEAAFCRKKKAGTDIKQKNLEQIEDYFGFKLDIIEVQSVQDYIELDHIHINPSCGSGALVIDEPEITPVQIGKKTIEQLFKVADYNVLKTFVASGDSMYDTITDGDTVLVDTSKLNYTNGGVFLFTKNNEWFIKRLRLKMNGDLEIISDNSKYGLETIKPTDDIEIIIKGKVIHNLSKVL